MSLTATHLVARKHRYSCEILYRMTVERLLNFSSHYPKRRTQGRRTNIERASSYAHDCIPSIRLTSYLFRCQKKKKNKGIGIYKPTLRAHRTYQLTPVKSFDVVWRCLGRDPNCVIIAIGHPESETRLQMMIGLNEKRRWRINRMSVSFARGNNGSSEGLAYINIPVASHNSRF